MANPPIYGTLAPYYDRIYSWKDYRGEARELLRLARAMTGRRPQSLLDVACGTGRHLAEFRRTVPEVAGLDVSRPMLREAGRKLGPRVPLLVRDMRSFDLGRAFDVVVCLFSAFGYLRTSKDRERAVRCFYRHVAPGGVLFVVGWVLPSRWKGNHVQLLTHEGPDVTLARLSRSWRRGRTSFTRMEYLVAERDSTTVRHFRELDSKPLLPAREIVALLRRAGFRATVRLTPPYEDRGLYIAVRPAAPPGGR